MKKGRGIRLFLNAAFRAVTVGCPQEDSGPVGKNAMMRALTLVVAVAVLVGTFRALSRFPCEYDFISYHLPAALRMAGLTTFDAPGHLAAAIEGHPPAPHFVLGGLVRLGGVSATVLLGGLSYTIWLCAFRWLAPADKHTHLLALLGLAVPLVLNQLFVPYVDLWVAVWTALAAFSVVCGVNEGINMRVATVFCVSMGIAACSKFTVWPVLAAVWVWAAWQWPRAAWTGRGGARWVAIGSLGLCLPLLAAWPMRNFLLFGNPTHPWQPPVLRGWLVDAAAARPIESVPERDVPDYLRPWPQPVRFICSALEAGRLVAPFVRYTHDMWNDFPSQQPHHRAGGWGTWTVFLVAWWWIDWWRTGDPRARRTSWFFALLTMVVMFTPRSHDLRYFLFWPLLAYGCLTHYHAIFIYRRRWIVQLCVGLMVAHLSPDVLSPGESSQEAATPVAAREFWVRARRDLIYEPPNDYRALFWAGPDFNTFVVRPGGVRIPENKP